MSANRDWDNAGFSDAQRRSFQEWKIPLHMAVRWRAVGVTEGLTATRWTIAGSSPDQVRAWESAGFDVQEAMQWHQFGHDVKSAAHEKAAGRAPGSRDSAGSALRTWRGPRGEVPGPALREWLGDQQRAVRAFPYLHADWITDDAIPWIEANIAPHDARVWALQKVRPAEAVVFERQGTTCMAVVREWWTAGVPVDQVAHWLGAGFTPQEASDHIAAGIDAERAAVLRALRDGTVD